MDSERPIGMRLHTLRMPAGARAIVIAAVCAAAAIACGTLHASSPASPAGPAGQTAAGRRPAAVSLVIRVTGQPGAPPRRWTLRCDPVGGTHPDAAKACRVLLHAKYPFAPPPRGAMCPMNAGERTATVKGTWFGRPVDAIFIQHGCGFPGWAKIRQIFN
jgi:hypothetical protein